MSKWLGLTSFTHGPIYAFTSAKRSFTHLLINPFTPLRIGMHSEIKITRWEGDTAREGQDAVAIEEPLEILINGERLAVTMRTPGDDLDLVAGFLFVEGIIQSASEILAMHPGPGQGGENRMYVRLKEDWKHDSQVQR